MIPADQFEREKRARRLAESRLDKERKLKKKAESNLEEAQNEIDRLKDEVEALRATKTDQEQRMHSLRAQLKQMRVSKGDTAALELEEALTRKQQELEKRMEEELERRSKEAAAAAQQELTAQLARQRAELRLGSLSSHTFCSFKHCVNDPGGA